MRRATVAAALSGFAVIFAAVPSFALDRPATNTVPVVKTPLKFTADKPDEKNCATIVASDPDGDPLTYSVVLQASQGVASTSGNQACYTYEKTYYSFADNFVVQVNDGFGGTGNVTVEVTIPAAGMVLKGDGGKDRLIGKGGKDFLYGFGENDYLDGQSNADTMDGGSGDDIYIVDHPDDRVIDADDGSTVRTYVSYVLRPESNDANVVVRGKGKIAVTGNNEDNTITGNDEANILKGGDGDDTLIGLGGPDRLEGGDSDKDGDTVNYKESPKAVNVDLRKGIGKGGDAQGDKLVSIENVVGSQFRDILRGTPLGNDIYGKSGQDKIYGGGAARGGGDVIYGGGDADILVGGPGSTLFCYQLGDSKAKAPDVIKGFIADPQNHYINLTTYRDGRNQILFHKFIGDAPFSGKRGEVRFADGRLEGDTDGDKKPELVIIIEVKSGTFSASNVLVH